MIALIVLLLVVWLAVGVVGFVIKGLLWLGVIAVVLFCVTGFLSWARGRSNSRSNT